MTRMARRMARKAARKDHRLVLMREAQRFTHRARRQAREDYP